MRYLLVLLLIAGLTACHPTKKEKATDGQATCLSSSDVSQLAERSRRFAFRLFHSLAPADTAAGNFFVSPFSAAVSAGMLANGAGGETRREILDAICMTDVPLERVNAYFSLLMDSLPCSGQEMTLAAASSLWTAERFSLLHPFREACQNYYRAETRSMDFTSPEAVETINRWCSEHTSGRIPQAVERLSEDDRLLLLNTLYFKGRWLEVFSKQDTREEEFHSIDGSTGRVDMMRQTEWFNLTRNEYFDIIRLPYTDLDFRMTILLPSEKKSWAECVNALTCENWSEWERGDTVRKEVDLWLPAFRLEDSQTLNACLRHLGMSRAFSPSEADLSGVSDDGSLYVSQICQSTFLEVNERGAEAAAGTLTEVVLLSDIERREPPYPFHCDRPFILFIEEVKSGAILFIGKVTRLG